MSTTGDGRVWRDRVTDGPGGGPVGRVEPLLNRTAHDRDSLRRKDSAYLDAAWTDALALVVTPDATVPVDETDDGPRLQWRPTDGHDVATRVYLGVLDGTPRFMVRAGQDLRADSWADLRTVGEFLPVADAGLMVEAVALAQWHDRHTHCPRCGAPTTYDGGGWTTRCTADGSEHFPRTDPAVIMLVHDGADRCVLGRQAVWPEGRFSILAGFVEPGESLEAAVAREVEEEVGLAVTDVRYVGSQSWPFPASVMLGFVCRVDDERTSDDALDLRDGEIAEARWFSRADLRDGVGYTQSPSAISIAHHIIRAWVEGRL